MATLKSIKNKYLVPADGTVLGVTTNTENISALSFKLATADSLTKFNMVDGFTDDYNDATGVAPASYTRHTVTAVGTTTWTAPANVTTVDALVVAGGGGGGRDNYSADRGAGGGGAGGIVHASSYVVVPGNNYTITVGAGGAGGDTANNGQATNGVDSVFGSITAIGGGGGAGHGAATNSGTSPGGSGGGGANGQPGGPSNQGDSGGGTGYGNDGGAGGAPSPYNGGGGGGANAVGGAGDGSNSGTGGDGKSFDISGAAVTYGGGGGGRGGSNAKPGGAGGGGAGGGTNPGTVNTGGGGGANRAAAGGNGGSGIVILRWSSASSNQIRNSTNNYYFGGTATAGAQVDFTTVGTTSWTAPTGLTTLTHIIVVAGGGGGGGAYNDYTAGGGGGAGGLLYQANRSVTGGSSYTVSIGAGGAGGDSGGDPGVDGSNTVFDNITAVGGGGGAAYGGTSNQDGGTGGGGARTGQPANSPGGTASQGDSGGATGYGYNGGVGKNYVNNNSNAAGGGGGTNGAGSGAGTQKGGDGGPGRDYSSFFGTSVGEQGWFSGGGGGGGAGPRGYANGGNGNLGGGGDGGESAQGGLPTTASSGGGGGGGCASSGPQPGRKGSDGAGGAIHFKYDAYSSEGGNMTLQSNVFTAQTAPTTARIIVDEEPVTGNTTLNTDIKAYASRDGTNFTQITLAKQADILNTGGIDANTKLLISCNGANGGSTFTDTSGEGATITKVGDPTTVTSQWKFNGSSMYLDGNDYLNITPEIFNDNDPFTIDFWVRGDNFGSSADWEHLVAISDTAGTGDILGVAVDTSGVLKVNHYAQDLDSGFTLAANTWYHIAACYDGTTQYVFVDGDLKASNTGYTYTLDGLPILIGARGWSPPIGSMFTGYMNEIRISTVARWTNSFTPPVTPYNSGTYVEPRRLLSGSADISGQPAGTNMKYKIETLNQSVSKIARVYGTSMAWA